MLSTELAPNIDTKHSCMHACKLACMCVCLFNYGPIFTLICLDRTVSCYVFKGPIGLFVDLGFCIIAMQIMSLQITQSTHTTVYTIVDVCRTI